MMKYQYPRFTPHAIEIAARLGLRRSRPGEWRGTCPACGYASAAVLSEREGLPLLWCASCNDRASLAALLRAPAGGSLPPQPAAPRDAASDAERIVARIERAREIWGGASPIEPGTPAAKYLEIRRISHVATSPALRWRSDCPHPAGGRRLALIAAVSAPDGEFAGVQRVFLKPDGTKADVEPVKASIGAISGGAVRLQDCSAELAIAEGVESAAAAGLILGMPAWAAVSAGNMANSLILPAEIRTVTIAADHDAPGIRAAEDAAVRWRDEGRSVRIIRATTFGKDAADVLAEAAL